MCPQTRFVQGRSQIFYLAKNQTQPNVYQQENRHKQDKRKSQTTPRMEHYSVIERNGPLMQPMWLIMNEKHYVKSQSLIEKNLMWFYMRFPNRETNYLSQQLPLGDGSAVRLDYGLSTWCLYCWNSLNINFEMCTSLYVNFTTQHLKRPCRK